jgi:hypothetical protein
MSEEKLIDRIKNVVSGFTRRKVKEEVTSVKLPKLTEKQKFQASLASMETALQEFREAPTDTALAKMISSSKSLFDRVSLPSRKNIGNLEAAAKLTISAETQTLNTSSTQTLSQDGQKAGVTTLVNHLLDYHQIFRRESQRFYDPTRDRLIEIGSDENHPMMFAVLNARIDQDIIMQIYYRLRPSLLDDQGKFVLTGKTLEKLKIFLAKNVGTRDILRQCLNTTETVQFDENRIESQLLFRYYRNLDNHLDLTQQLITILKELAQSDRNRAIDLVRENFITLRETMASLTGDNRFYPEGVVLRKNYHKLKDAYLALTSGREYIPFDQVIAQASLSDKDVDELRRRFPNNIWIERDRDGTVLIKIVSLL